MTGWLVAEDPAGDLDVVDIAAADARRVKGKGANLPGLRRPELDVVNLDERHESTCPFVAADHRAPDAPGQRNPRRGGSWSAVQTRQP